MHLRRFLQQALRLFRRDSTPPFDATPVAMISTGTITTGKIVAAGMVLDLTGPTPTVTFGAVDQRAEHVSDPNALVSDVDARWATNMIMTGTIEPRHIVTGPRPEPITTIVNQTGKKCTTTVPGMTIVDEPPT